MMPAKVFEAKLGGLCSICKKEVKGTRVAYNKDKQLCHADCLWPNKANASHPHSQAVNTPPSQSQAEGNGPAMKASLPIPKLTPIRQAQWISDATEAMKLAGLDKDIESNLLVELVRQYHSEFMMKGIQAGKQANIEAVRRERGN